MSAVATPFMGFAEEFRTPGQPVIQPERFADALNLRVQDLAKLAGVHRTTVTETPANARLQRVLREALRALSAAYEVTQDRDRAIFWFRNTPIPEFGHRTAETIVAGAAAVSAADSTDPALKPAISPRRLRARFENTSRNLHYCHRRH